MTVFCFGIVNPAASVAAEKTNAPLLGHSTLGIEVTDVALAARCGLGNIDPQHHAASFAQHNIETAIEAAMSWPLPPEGSHLVTIRADLDALGAMAVLAFRVKGGTLSNDFKKRVAAVSKVDRFDFGPWPGVRSLPTSSSEIAEEAGSTDVAIMSAHARNAVLALADRVAAIEAWLVSGQLPASARAAPTQRAERLLAGLRDGQITVHDAVPGHLAVLHASIDGALRLGYRRAPVVVAINREHPFPDGTVGLKYTIAQYRLGYADLDRVVSLLQARDPGWGGSPTIKGSPQGQPSRLQEADVVQTVVSALL